MWQHTSNTWYNIYLQEKTPTICAKDTANANQTVCSAAALHLKAFNWQNTNFLLFCSKLDTGLKDWPCLLLWFIKKCVYRAKQCSVSAFVDR